MKAYYKAQADALRGHLSQIGISITHSQALETISRINGFNNWDTFVAKLNSYADMRLDLNISSPDIWPAYTPKLAIKYFLEMPTPFEVSFFCSPRPYALDNTVINLPTRLLAKEEAKEYLRDPICYWTEAAKQDIMQEYHITSEQFDIFHVEYKKRHDDSLSHSCIGKTSRGKRCLNRPHVARGNSFGFFIKYKNSPFYYCDIHKDQVPYDQRKQFAIMYYDEYPENSPTIRELKEVFALKLGDARELHYQYSPKADKAKQ